MDLRKGYHSQQDFADWYIESGRGSEDILMEVLQICEPEELNRIEGIWFAQDPPRFYGQMPSTSRKWYLSAETRAKMSKTHREKIQSAKANGTYASSWSFMDEESRKSMSIHNRQVGFNSITAAAAGRKSLGRPKSEQQRRKASEIAKRAAKEILSCSICEKECKGKSALGRHMTVHS